MGKKRRLPNIDRKEAKTRIESGWGIIDTSGRTRVSRERSTVALASKNISYAVQCKANSKTQIFRAYKNCYPKEDLNVIIHATCIFYCLDPHIDTIPGVFICADGMGPGRLTHHLQRMLGQKYQKNKVLVYSSLAPFLGKKNAGDRLAYFTNRKGGCPPSRLLGINELERFLKKKA